MKQCDKSYDFGIAISDKEIETDSLPQCIQHTTMHTEYYNAYSILQCIQNTKMRTEYYNAYSILQCIQHTTMHTAYYNAYRILQCIQNSIKEDVFEWDNKICRSVHYFSGRNRQIKR